MLPKRIKEEDSLHSETPSPKRSKLEGGPVKSESIKSEAADHGDISVDTGRQIVRFKQCTAEVYRTADGRLFVDPPFPIVRATFDLLKGVRSSSKQVIKKGDLDLIYFKPYLTTATATALYNWCLQELPWFKVQYKARGMDINTPRFTTTFGVDASYTGQTMAMYDRPPRKIPDTLQTLLDAVSEATGIGYNFVLMNFYGDGTHSISYHSDDEKFLGLNPTIASLSLGGSRDFLMKHKDDGKKTEKFPLESGDMLVMQGTTQSKWLHSIPKRKSSVQPRVNITFRKAMNAAGTNNYYKYNVGDGGVYRMLNGKMQLAV